MKKIIFAVLAIGVLGAQLAHADVMPEGKKSVPVCSTVYNMSEFPKLTIYTRETGPMLQTPVVTKPASTDCVSVGYKFNTLEVYAVDADYAKTLPATFDPGKDSKAYKANINLAAGVDYVDEADKTEYIHNEYDIAGIDNVKKQLMIQLVTTKTNLKTTDIKAEVLNGLDKAIVTANNAVKPPFTDVSSSSPYFDALVYLKSSGVISGYNDGSFKPNQTINRAEFTKIIVGATQTDNGLCMEGFANKDGSYQKLFSDTVTSAWYMNFVCIAKTSKLVDGYADGTFKPEKEINFVEAAKIIANAFKLNATSTTPWYKGYVDVVGGKNAIPMTITTFDQKITRGEMAEMVYRLMYRPDLKIFYPSQMYLNLK